MRETRVLQEREIFKAYWSYLQDQNSSVVVVIPLSGLNTSDLKNK
jgi:hypothetical protein